MSGGPFIVTLHRDGRLAVVGPFRERGEAIAYARDVNDGPLMMANVRELRAPAAALDESDLTHPVGFRDHWDPEHLMALDPLA